MVNPVHKVLPVKMVHRGHKDFPDRLELQARKDRKVSLEQTAVASTSAAFSIRTLRMPPTTL
jgi:hypothetical protein